MAGGDANFTIKTSYFFNDGDERIQTRTTVTAINALTNVAIARSVHPDSAGAGDLTKNQRRTSALSIDDFMGSQSVGNCRTLALANLNGDALRHTTQIDSHCCDNINPYNVLKSQRRSVNRPGQLVDRRPRPHPGLFSRRPRRRRVGELSPAPVSRATA